MMQTWWVSCDRYTGIVKTKNGVIIEAEYRIRGFLNQDIDVFLRHAKNFGNLKWKIIDGYGSGTEGGMV